MKKNDGNISVERYLTYLDKEMTIMGILSGFCIAVLAASIKLVTSDNVAMSRDLVQASPLSLLIAHIMLLMAGLSFYNQRSHLAWFYGQISLEDSGYATNQRLHEWLADADAWDTWIKYQRGFSLLAGAFCELAVAAVGAYLYAGKTIGNSGLISAIDDWGGSIVAVIIVVGIVLQKIILEKWSHEENPYEEFRKAVQSVLGLKY